ncbi:histone deacetylase hosB [Aspergillus clavatus NRRL 1]|uniref:Histone deacetylase HosB n=1 Tax=Aspergillus clavatus (strain ATCC 1007 / CBS 513.65 / DSM 816 / NCTC 3887 / NRRL 1 / QM 1276 / 107) TaxID=344612 RepID=A1C940_ASPCL|nr:histone deacetylase HosB [Aspergillus clavatus NRRL 1]EAW13364.1 histone deacetylase HosB [Aspergillus clavatus NRRL 1]
MSSKKPLEQTTPTASSMAAEFFQQEMNIHQSEDLKAKTIVVVHDACYGHRFSRPRTSKTALSYIVERPERIQACVLGVSAAYVHMACRHAGKRFAPHPDLDPHQLPVPPFQIRKTSRTLPLSSAAVTHVHGTKWMEDLKTMCDAAESRLALNGKELVRPRSSGKDSDSTKKAPLNDGDLYLCAESLNAFEGALGGVCEGIDAVFSPGATQRAFVCIRPPGHHCSVAQPSGFCWINNVHVGITYAAMTHGLTHAAILDFDLHHGDGSQDIAWEQNQKALSAVWNAANHKKTRIGYFSLHDINSFPCEGGDPEKVRNASVCIDKAHGQSIWNVHLETWKDEAEFWEIYGSKYTLILEKARAFLRLHTERLLQAPHDTPPKAAIFISAGFDASEWEGSGMQRHQVNVPTEFYAKFTADVVRMAEEEGLGVDGRVISVLEGGYSNRALTSGVLSHLAGLGDKTTMLADVNGTQQAGLAYEMFDRLHIAEHASTETRRTLSDVEYDTEWWASTALEDLEALVYAPAPHVSKSKSAPTYFAPTRSFTAKVVPSSRDRRSSGSQTSLDAIPLPEIPWTTAAHELSKILIPSHRQVSSYRPEELNAEASRLRRERHTAAVAAQKPGNVPGAATAPEASRMQLRTRKPKTSLPSSPQVETPKKQVMKSNRRTTIDPASDLPGSSTDRSPIIKTTRRKSATSTPVASGKVVAIETAQGQPGALTTISDRSAMSEVDAKNRPLVSSGSRRPSTSRVTTPKLSESNVPPVPPLPPATSVPSTVTRDSLGDELRTLLDDGKMTTAQDGETKRADVDDLTAGVKKLSIKLKVPTPEEHAAREKERKAAEDRKRRTSKGTTSRPRLPKKASSAVAGSQTSVAKQTSRPSSSRGTQQAPDFNRSTQSAPIDIIKQESEEMLHEDPIASSPDPLVEPGMPQLNNVTIQRPRWERSVSASALAPESSSVPVTSPTMAQESIPVQSKVYAPPTTAGQTMKGFPVFTASGPIPFAAAGLDNSNQENWASPSQDHSSQPDSDHYPN